MKTHLQVSLVLILLIAPSALQAQLSGSAVPDSLSFQGLLTDAGGDTVNATVSMTFKLYNNGAAVWTETQPAVVVTDGVFNVILGGVAPLDMVAFNEPIELGITVGGNPEMEPRTPIAAAPFALGMRGMHAVWAEDGDDASFNVIAGASNNVVGPGVVGATIGGGGGTWNGIARPNSVNGLFGTIAGGGLNTAGALFATVGGGFNNTASGAAAVVSGGQNNSAGAGSATVGGGLQNTASGSGSTVPGGYRNAARSAYSFAAGYNARPQHEGSFVWGDRSVLAEADSLETTGPNQFLVRAAGGVGIGTNSPAAPLDIAGGNWNLNTSEGDFRIGNATNRLKIGVAIDGEGAGRTAIRAQGDLFSELRLGAEDVDVVVIDPAGVAIGTSAAPGARLDVAGGNWDLNTTEGDLRNWQQHGTTQDRCRN